MPSISLLAHVGEHLLEISEPRLREFDTGSEHHGLDVRFQSITRDHIPGFRSITVTGFRSKSVTVYLDVTSQLGAVDVVAAILVPIRRKLAGLDRL